MRSCGSSTKLREEYRKYPSQVPLCPGRITDPPGTSFQMIPSVLE